MAIELDMPDARQVRRVFTKRLGQSREEKKVREQRWDIAERAAYATNGFDEFGGVTTSPSAGDSDAPADPTLAINLAFKNLRFIHSQLSANPPVVIPRPSTSDPEDKHRARAADTVCRYSLRQYGLQESFDQCTLGMLVRGLGCLKVYWDASLGSILGRTRDGGLILEGDIRCKPVSARKLHIDTDAESPTDIRWVIEEIDIPVQEAMRLWPKKAKLIEQEWKNQCGGDLDHSTMLAQDEGRIGKRESIKVFEYWETGLPTNAYLGRFGVFIEDGRQLQPLKPSPHAFVPSLTPEEVRAVKRGKKVKRKSPVARLPYHFCTDIDVLESVWGKSFLDYEAPLQDTHNRVLSVGLENLQAHGVSRLILPEGMDVVEGQVTNSPYDIIRLKTDGTTGDPHFIAPMAMPAVWADMSNIVRGGLDDMAGMNESMFGQQSREMSGSSMQYAVNQGNVIRRRLFNKYVLLVEAVYKTILDLARSKWPNGKLLSVIGKEKAFESVEFKTADIDGGFDLVVEYGTSLSLDPMERRDQLMRLQPLLEKAGVQPRKFLSLLRLNDLEEGADSVQMAEDRQREIFERMFVADTYMPPAPMMDHEGMIAWGMEYIMTADFDALKPSQQAMVRRHIYERGQVQAMEKAGMTWMLLGLPQPPQFGAQPPAALPGVPGPTPTPTLGGPQGPAAAPGAGIPGAPAPMAGVIKARLPA